MIFAFPVSAMAQAMENTSTDSHEPIPYQLLIRLLKPFPGSGAVPQLQFGSAEAAELPANLPTPQGTLQWSLLAPPESFTFLFEIPQPRSQAEATYLKHMQAAGWQPQLMESPAPTAGTEPSRDGTVSVPIVVYGDSTPPESELFIELIKA